MLYQGHCLFLFLPREEEQDGWTAARWYVSSWSTFILEDLQLHSSIEMLSDNVPGLVLNTAPGLDILRIWGWSLCFSGWFIWSTSVTLTILLCRHLASPVREGSYILTVEFRVWIHKLDQCRLFWHLSSVDLGPCAEFSAHKEGHHILPPVWAEGEWEREIVSLGSILLVLGVFQGVVLNPIEVGPFCTT